MAELLVVRELSPVSLAALNLPVTVIKSCKVLELPGVRYDCANVCVGEGEFRLGTRPLFEISGNPCLWAHGFSL